jgi:prepilin-type N-terminal cleavage/methylation domain-containing protein
MKKTRYTTAAGFSLVEMLVSVSVLLIVIVGPMTVTSRAAKSSSFATEQVQAFFLAQEGLEIAQKIRDDLLLLYFAGGTTNPWARFTDSTTLGTYRHCYNGGCGLDWNTTLANDLATPVNCTSAAAPSCRLYYRPTAVRSKFTHASTPAAAVTVTPFTRRIQFSKVGDNSVEVRSIVTWRTGSIAAEQRVESTTYLYKYNHVIP